jgi:hypothetical protein
MEIIIKNKEEEHNNLKNEIEIMKNESDGLKKDLETMKTIIKRKMKEYSSKKNLKQEEEIRICHQYKGKTLNI